jgi:hypothetical protein
MCGGLGVVSGWARKKEEVEEHVHWFSAWRF